MSIQSFQRHVHTEFCRALFASGYDTRFQPMRVLPLQRSRFVAPRDQRICDEVRHRVQDGLTVGDTVTFDRSVGVVIKLVESEETHCLFKVKAVPSAVYLRWIRASIRNDHEH